MKSKLIPQCISVWGFIAVAGELKEFIQMLWTSTTSSKKGISRDELAGE
jgi:hypothetical protein